MYVLMGIKNTKPDVIEKINKRSDTLHDYRACQLLKQQGIYSVIGHIVGFEDETWADFRSAQQALALLHVSSYVGVFGTRG